MYLISFTHAFGLKPSLGLCTLKPYCQEMCAAASCFESWINDLYSILKEHVYLHSMSHILQKTWLCMFECMHRLQSHTGMLLKKKKISIPFVLIVVSGSQKSQWLRRNSVVKNCMSSATYKLLHLELYFISYNLLLFYLYKFLFLFC